MIFALLLMLAQGNDPPHPETACDDPQTQAEMNRCSGQELEAADAELNAQWQVTVDAMRRLDDRIDSDVDKQAGHYATLLEAQRAWLAFRDAQCRSESFMARGGSMQPMIAARCRTYLTMLRTEQLRSLAAGPEGR